MPMDAMTKEWGDAAAALAAAPVRIEHEYKTPREYNVPIEPHGLIARWQGDSLTVWEPSQWIDGMARSYAEWFGLPFDKVRLISPYIGGGFGSKGFAYAYGAVAAMAAKMLDRPVKLAVTRPQTFTSFGGRPATRQTIALGATREGKLLSIVHRGANETSVDGFAFEPLGSVTSIMYATPNFSSRQNMVPVNTVLPGALRAPGENPSAFGIESAMDELAYEVGIDPLEIRLLNYAEQDPSANKPWSTRRLREAFAEGAKAFGWSKRKPAPAVDARGQPAHRLWARRRHLSRPPHARRGAGADPSGWHGGGRQQQHRYGDRHLYDPGPDRGRCDRRSGRTRGGEARRFRSAARARRRRIAAGESDDRRRAQGGAGRPRGADRARHQRSQIALPRDAGEYSRHRPGPDLLAARGRLGHSHCRAHAAASGRERIEALRDTLPAGRSEEDRFKNWTTIAGMLSPTDGDYSLHSWCAHFVEVRVDEDFGTVRIARMVSALDSGRLYNPKLAESQWKGGIIMGIGQALLEEGIVDTRYGRVLNNNLGDYLIATNADIPALEVISVGIPDHHASVLGGKAVGELSIVGVAAAIANAVYHATGKRVRELPITLEKLI